MKKEKKDLAKLALAGLLLAATLPAAAEAEVNNARETYLAVAGCGKCSGSSYSTGNSHSCAQPNRPNSYGGGDVAEADNLSTPPGTNTGAMTRNRPPSTNPNGNAGTGARTTGGGYGNTDDSYRQANRNANNPYGN
jgi:hypothetical protein